VLCVLCVLCVFCVFCVFCGEPRRAGARRRSPSRPSGPS